MGIKEMLLGKSEADTPNVAYRLTESGKDKLEKSSDFTPEAQCLDAINNMGSANVREIAKETGIDRDKVNGITRSLKTQGYLKKAG